MRREFLSNADAPTERVRCPIHGFIRYSKNERKIVDHPVFQRLRNVRQLAMEYLVYPGAMHTRFEHSLGVMHMAGQMFEALAERHSDRITSCLREVPELAEDTLPKARQLVRLMGLLHDVGHPAFAHSGEAVIPGKDHEKVSVYAIREVLGALLDGAFFPGVSTLLIRLMEKTSPEMTFLSQIVSGEMDADRADYLLRDSWHCGVRYGVYDWDRLLESLTLFDDPDSGRLGLALERGGEHTFEAMILARYQMSTQVYFHKIRRIYDHYLAEYNLLWGPENYRDYSDVFRHDDLSVFQEIRQDAQGDAPRSVWAKRIVNRDHHRVVYETPDNADMGDLKRTKRLLAAIEGKWPEVDFFHDTSRLTIYKLWVPGEQEEQKVENLYIVGLTGQPNLLTKESAVVSKVPKSVHTVRIFADARDGLLSEIRNEAKNLAGTI